MTVIRRDSDEVRSELTALPGTGRWTCSMFQLFYAGEPDFLPVEDGLSGSHSHGSTAPRSTTPPHGRSSAWIDYTILDSFMRYGRYPRKAGRDGRPEAFQALHRGVQAADGRASRRRRAAPGDHGRARSRPVGPPGAASGASRGGAALSAHTPGPGSKPMPAGPTKPSSPT